MLGHIPPSATVVRGHTIYIYISGKNGPPLGKPHQHHVSLCTYFGAICDKYDFGKYNIFL